MKRQIKHISSDADKVECYKLTTEILGLQVRIFDSQRRVEELKLKLRTKCSEIVAKAGEGYRINEEFDAVIEREE